MSFKRVTINYWLSENNHKSFSLEAPRKKTCKERTIKGNQAWRKPSLSGSLVTYQCGEAVIEFSAMHLKMLEESDTYILAGVLLFTMNADCSAPAVFIYG